jgi:hypothetical protein
MSDALYLPRLRPDQWRIASHPAKVKVISMGRRWGKTTMAGAIALACANDGGRVAWVVPTYKNARPVWRWVEASVGPLLKGGAVVANRTDRAVEFPATGGYLGVYSADSDVGLRGEAFHLAVLEEAARISERTWNEVVMPTLADYAGDAILISTPMGRNWFWREWERGRAQMDAEQAAFTAPSTDNPMPTIARAADLARQRVPEGVFRQEWMAEFLEDSGGVFRRVRDAATATPQEQAIAGHRYCVGVDWGKLNDFTVLSVIDTTTKEQVHQDRSNKVDYTVQVGRLRALCERFKPDAVYAEQNSMGEPIIEQLQRLNLPVFPFQTTNASKAGIIDGLALAFERGELRVLDDDVCVGELLAYHAERLPSGLLRYSAPEGLHDDCVMALALAWMGAGSPSQWVF